MMYAEFMQAFNPVVAAFGHGKFNPVVLDRIAKKLADFSRAEILSLNDLLLDQCDRAPNTHKILEFANIIRARRQAKSENTFEYVIDCKHCHDIGITRVQTEGIDVLMRCNCKWGELKKTETILPQFSRDAEQIFTRSAPPLEWFKPESWNTGKHFTITAKEIQNRIEYWKAKISIAEDYWCAHIPELEAQRKLLKKLSAR